MFRLSLISIFTFVVCSSFSWAGPPYQTDDPYVPPIYSWENNIPYTLTVTPTTSTMQIPLFDINFTLFPNVVVKFDPQIVRAHTSGDGTSTGFGDTLTGILWRFFGDNESRIQLAVEPQILIPTGNQSRSLGLGKPNLIPLVIGQIRGENWKYYGNFAYIVQLASGRKDYWFYGNAFVYELTKQLEIGLEIYGNTKLNDGGKPFIGFNGGVEWDLLKYLNVLFSMGRSFQEGRSLTFYIGPQFNLSLP